MTKPSKTAVYDAALQLEAYRFSGIMQPFPAHFHEHYVLGVIVRGQRQLMCRGQATTIQPGDVLLFAPGESHACTQSDGGQLDYCALNIGTATMRALSSELTGTNELPGFDRAVVRDDDIASQLRALHALIMEEAPLFAREERLLLLMALLFNRHAKARAAVQPETRTEVIHACAYIEEHFAEHLSLATLCTLTGLSKSTLLRAFTKAKGITPYRYLETVRISAASKLLEQGALPLDAALATGFADQSHFTNQFTRFIGLSPGAYRDMFLKHPAKGGDCSVQSS